MAIKFEHVHHLILEVQRRIQTGEGLYQGLSPTSLMELDSDLTKSKNLHGIAKSFYLFLSMIQNKQISSKKNHIVDAKSAKIENLEDLWKKIKKYSVSGLEKNLIEGVTSKHLDSALLFMHKKMVLNE